MKATKRFKSIIKLFRDQNIEDALRAQNGFVDTIFPPIKTLYLIQFQKSPMNQENTQNLPKIKKDN